MQLAELLQFLPITCPGGEIPEADIKKIEYDSRVVDADCLFICMPGSKHDGHDYAREAYDAGCRYFLCERTVDLPEDACQFLTQDSHALLSEISARLFGRPSDSLHLIGITGTKGKTTTALMTQAILNKTGHPSAYIGTNGVVFNGHSYSSRNTTPESRDLHRYFRQMVDEGIEFVVMEVSSQALAYHRTDGLKFEVTAFLNLSPDHIGKDEHATFEDYMDAKSSLFTDHGTECIIYNADEPFSEQVLRRARAPRVSFSLSKPADFTADRLESYRDDTSLGVAFDCHHDNRTIHLKLRMPGDFNVGNALAALAITSQYGIRPEDTISILEEIAVTGRFEIVGNLPGRTFVIDYSHNGVSLRHALTVLREYDPKRLVCVFGSVGGRTEGRREEMARASARLADLSIITSDNPDDENPNKIIQEIAFFFPSDVTYEMVTDREAAVRHAVRSSKPGDIVLFAGKGHETYQVVNGIKEPFSEKNIIEDECRAVRCSASVR